MEEWGNLEQGNVKNLNLLSGMQKPRPPRKQVGVVHSSAVGRVSKRSIVGAPQPVVNLADILKDSDYKLSQFKPDEVDWPEQSIFLKQTSKGDTPYINRT